MTRRQTNIHSQNESFFLVTNHKIRIKFSNTATDIWIFGFGRIKISKLRPWPLIGNLIDRSKHLPRYHELYSSYSCLGCIFIMGVRRIKVLTFLGTSLKSVMTNVVHQNWPLKARSSKP